MLVTLLIVSFVLINMIVLFPSAMVSRLDQSIGKVMQALNDSAMLNNSIVIFYSDNGAATVGMHGNSGSNYPFRGVSIFKVF